MSVAGGALLVKVTVASADQEAVGWAPEVRDAPTNPKRGDAGTAR